MWGNKVRFVWMTAEEDQSLLCSDSIFEPVWKANMPADSDPGDFTARSGCSYVAAFAGVRLLAFALVEPEEYRVHFIGGELYYRGRHVGHALKRYAFHGR